MVPELLDDGPERQALPVQNQQVRLHVRFDVMDLLLYFNEAFALQKLLHQQGQVSQIPFPEIRPFHASFAHEQKERRGHAILDEIIAGRLSQITRFARDVEDIISQLISQPG